MKNKIRTMAMLLCAALLVTCLGACGAPAPTVTTPPTAAPAVSAAAPAAATPTPAATPAASIAPAKRTEISWAMWVTEAVEDYTELEKRFEEKIPDVDIKFIGLERATWREQINTRVAGGDVPDIIYRDSQQVVAQYANQGVICEVPIAKCAEFAPNIYEATKSFGKDVWLATNVSGKNYGLPIMQPGNVAPFSDMWRMDYLEKIGVTKLPETLEEAEAVFEKVIKTDLNGAGAGKTYGMTYRAKDMSHVLFPVVFAAFGTLPDKWMLQGDGTLVTGYMKDGAQDALTVLADWYKKGYIDPEFVTTDAAVFKQKVAGGNIALLTWGTWGRAQPPQGEFYVDATSGDPNAKVVPGPALKGPGGDYAYYTWGKVTSSTAFGKHLAQDEAKLNRCLDVVDFVSANTDDNEYIRSGVINVDWKRDPTLGTKINLHTEANDKAKFGSALLGAVNAVPALADRYARTDNNQYNMYATQGTLQPEVDYISWVSIFANSEILSQTADVDPVFRKGLIDIIIGARPVTDYEKLRADWYAGGGKAVTDEINRAYREGKAEMDAILEQVK